MPKPTFFLLSGLLAAPTAQACTWCRPRVQAGIYTPAYSANVLLVLLPAALLLALGVVVFYWDKLRPTPAAAHVSR